MNRHHSVAPSSSNDSDQNQQLLDARGSEMRTYKILALLVLVVVVALFTRNNAHALGRRALHSFSYFQTVKTGSMLAVLQPKPGAKLSSGTVVVQYALQPAATVQSTPTFELRLDASDPVRTADTSYTFTGVNPGAHSVSLVVLDANNVPVANTQTEVQFTVVSTSGTAQPQAEEQVNEAATLAENDGSLSILGVVGFGILVGGALSIYRNRENHPARRSER